MAEIRYSYREVAPEKVFLPAAELWKHLPGDLRCGQSPEGGQVAVPSGDLFSGNTPGITLARLGLLCPELVRLPEGHDPSERVTLPPGWLAMHFQLETHREELPPEEPIPAHGDDAPETADLSPVENMETVEDAPTMEVPQKRGLFASLPIFRRRQPEALSAEAPKHVASPDPISLDHQDSVHPGEGDKPLELRVVKAETAEAIVSTEAAAVPVLEALWKLGPQDRIADQAALQTLFMTGEQLTLERVVCLASELPGLKACLLAHGDRVLCAPNASPEVDLRTLSNRAMTMLAQIRESSEAMGLGAVPAVTLHGELGALSFLHHGELCLLVFHAGHGFVPGVRERLQEVLGHLAGATPALA